MVNFFLSLFICDSFVNFVINNSELKNESWLNLNVIFIGYVKLD